MKAVRSFALRRPASLSHRDGVAALRHAVLLPLTLLLLLFSPLLRGGIPLTEAGAALSKPLLVALLVGGAALVAAATAALWGRRWAWWGAALWLTLPLVAGALYQAGGQGWLVSAPTLTPYALLATIWPDPASPREWLSAPVWSLGWVPLLLAGLVIVLAWERRGTREGRRVLALALGAALLVALALLGGPTRLLLTVAATLLVLIAAGLPTLDPRYGSLPVLVGALALAALSSYPALRPAWLDAPPTTAPLATFGGGEVALLEARAWRDGDTLIVEALWQATTPVPRDPTAFVQFLDASGAQIAQADALLSDSDGLPATAWPVGYLVRQRYEATGPAATQVRLGLYDRETLGRLITAGHAATVGPGGDHLLLPVE